MTTRIIEHFDTGEDRPARGVCVFAAHLRTEGNRVITGDHIYERLIDGNLAADLLPGPTAVKMEVAGYPKGWQKFLVPDSTTPVRLSDLVLAPLPPDVVLYVRSFAGLSGDISAEHLAEAIGDKIPPPVYVPLGFSHVQATPAGAWSIMHNLGRYPAAVSVLIGDELVDADVTHPSVDQTVVTFATPASGRVELL